MNPLELRKIIVIGAKGAAPQGVGLLDRDGLPATPLMSEVTLRMAFWVPMPAPHQRCAGTSEVINAQAFELQALRDGAITEVVEELTFSSQPSLDEMRRRLMPVWEGLTVESLGVLPNGAPVDLKPKLALQFTAVP